MTETIKIKYHTDKIDKLTYIDGKSDWIDLRAAEDVVLKPSECAKVKTGIAFEPPEGYGIMVYPRSGISSKTTLRFANSVGVIDNDYRGEVIILLENAMPKPMVNNLVPAYSLIDGTLVEQDYKYWYLPLGMIVIKRGDRIAQAMPIKIEKATLVRESELSETKRGKGGLGSTGTK